MRISSEHPQKEKMSSQCQVHLVYRHNAARCTRDGTFLVTPADEKYVQSPWKYVWMKWLCSVHFAEQTECSPLRVFKAICKKNSGCQYAQAFLPQSVATVKDKLAACWNQKSRSQIVFALHNSAHIHDQLPRGPHVTCVMWSSSEIIRGKKSQVLKSLGSEINSLCKKMAELLSTECGLEVEDFSVLYALTNSDCKAFPEQNFKTGPQIIHADTSWDCWDVHGVLPVIGTGLTEFLPVEEDGFRYVSRPSHRNELRFPIGSDGEYGWDTKPKRGCVEPGFLVDRNGKAMDRPRSSTTSSSRITLFNSRHPHRGPGGTVEEKVGGGRLALFFRFVPPPYRREKSSVANVEGSGCGVETNGVATAEFEATRRKRRKVQNRGLASAPP